MAIAIGSRTGFHDSISRRGKISFQAGRLADLQPPFLGRITLAVEGSSPIKPFGVSGYSPTCRLACCRRRVRSPRGHGSYPRFDHPRLGNSLADGSNGAVCDFPRCVGKKPLIVPLLLTATLSVNFFPAVWSPRCVADVKKNLKPTASSATFDQIVVEEEGTRKERETFDSRQTSSPRRSKPVEMPP